MSIIQDIKAYGAAGNGVTDDTPALRTAFAAGVFELPPGAYRFTEPLTIDGGAALDNKIEITGAGQKRTTLFYDGTASPAITIIGEGGHARALTLTNLSLKATPAFTGTGILIETKWHPHTKIRDVTFEDWRGTALRLNKGYGLYLRDVYFRSCGMALHLGGEMPGVDFVNAVYLDNVTIEFCTSTLEVVRVEQARVFHWRGGFFEGNNSGIHLKNAVNYSLKDMYFEQNGTNTPWIEIERCGPGIVDNNFMPAIPGATMIRLQGRCLGNEAVTCTISNNTFDNYTTPPVALGTPQVQAFPPLLLNNYFQGTSARLAFVLLQPPTEPDYAPLAELTDNRWSYYDHLGNPVP